MFKGTKVYTAAEFYKTNVDPRILPGLPAEIGYFCFLDKGAVTDIYQHTGIDHTDWTLVRTIPTPTDNSTISDIMKLCVIGISTIAETSKYYIDGSVGDDLTADGTIVKPFKTITACMAAIGQPISMQDYMRHIEIHFADALTALIGNNGGANQSWNGVYKEGTIINPIIIPNRPITFFGAGIKIGNNVNAIDSGYGNILKEYSKARCFGVSSSDMRPCLSIIGNLNVRDTHNRLRNGFHIGGFCRTSILNRNISSIQGNGVNTVTIEVAAGQFDYPITILTAAQITAGEPRIRIKVNNCTTVAYNTTYDITSKIDNTHFIATRVSGTNAATTIETGNFFECDSAGASGLSHDSVFIDCYMQGSYTCDDATVNDAAPTAGTEVLYSINSRWFTGMQGRGILCQRWEDTTLAGVVSFTAGNFIKGQKYTITAIGNTDFTLIGAATNTVGLTFVATGIGVGSGTATLNTIINSIAGMFNSSLSGSFELASFTYSADDMGWINNRFNSALTITLTTAGQTVRMDKVTFASFSNVGCTFVTNTPTIEMLDKDASGTTLLRPTIKYIGQRYFDTTLNKPIWWTGTAWVDATGLTV